MRYLKENTATRITVGPFLDKTDGITPEIALTVTACLLTFVVDDAGVPTLVLDIAPTASGGSNDMVHITSDAAGFYDLELAAANVNYTGRAMLAITDAAVHCPVFHEFQIVSANVYDSLFTDGDVLDVNTTQWLGTAAATPTTAGVPEVDVTFVSGTAQTANDNGADINTLITQIGTAGAGLTNITLANDLSATMKTSVLAEVNTAIDTAISELGVAAPTATPTIRTGMMLMYMALRNKLVVQTSGTDAIEIYNDAGTKIAAKTITDDGTDYTEAEMA